MAKATPAAIALYGKAGAFEMSRVPCIERYSQFIAPRGTVHLSSEFLVYFYYQLMHYNPKWTFYLAQLICQICKMRKIWKSWSNKVIADANYEDN